MRQRVNKPSLVYQIGNPQANSPVYRINPTELQSFKSRLYDITHWLQASVAGKLLNAFTKDRLTRALHELKEIVRQVDTEPEFHIIINLIKEYTPSIKGTGLERFFKEIIKTGCCLTKTDLDRLILVPLESMPAIVFNLYQQDLSDPDSPSCHASILFLAEPEFPPLGGYISDGRSVSIRPLGIVGLNAEHYGGQSLDFEQQYLVLKMLFYNRMVLFHHNRTLANVGGAYFVREILKEIWNKQGILGKAESYLDNALPFETYFYQLGVSITQIISPRDFRYVLETGDFSYWIDTVPKSILRKYRITWSDVAPLFTDESESREYFIFSPATTLQDIENFTLAQGIVPKKKVMEALGTNTIPRGLFYSLGTRLLKFKENADTLIASNDTLSEAQKDKLFTICEYTHKDADYPPAQLYALIEELKTYFRGKFPYRLLLESATKLLGYKDIEKSPYFYAVIKLLTKVFSGAKYEEGLDTGAQFVLAEIKQGIRTATRVVRPATFDLSQYGIDPQVIAQAAARTLDEIAWESDRDKRTHALIKLQKSIVAETLRGLKSEHEQGVLDCTVDQKELGKLRKWLQS